MENVGKCKDGAHLVAGGVEETPWGQLGTVC